MKASTTLAVVATIAQSIGAVAAPNPTAPDDGALDTRSQPDFELVERSPDQEKWKRKGGGGGGGRGSGGSSSGKGSGSSSGSSGSSGGRGSASSNSGGRTTTGSGVTPAYGAGGAFYAGGSKEPYKSGATRGSIVPFVAGGAAVGFLGGAYLAGAYVYPYHHQYYFHNDTTNQNETKPVVCVCDQYNECSCEDNGDQEYFESIVGDGRYENLNKSVVNVAYNETDNKTYIYLLGTLPNGTTAAGGDEDPNAACSLKALLHAAGWWPVIATSLVLAFVS
ncbi:hypothetical protein MGN70_006110 [Eutypa lata]|nr:hypothetical protein MGN70_006110 [Eutypa lata]